MLNPKTGERELAYIVSVGWVRPIEGADNIELIGKQKEGKLWTIAH